MGSRGLQPDLVLERRELFHSKLVGNRAAAKALRQEFSKLTVKLFQAGRGCTAPFAGGCPLHSRVGRCFRFETSEFAGGGVRDRLLGSHEKTERMFRESGGELAGNLMGAFQQFFPLSGRRMAGMFSQAADPVHCQLTAFHRR
jgi:hypothetical protein